MILDVHVAFLFAALSVLFGITYTLGQFLNHKIEQAKAKHSDPGQDTDLVEQEEVFIS